MVAAAAIPAVIAATAAVVGAGVATYGAVQQAEAQSAADEANAAISEQQAQVAREQATMERRRAAIEAEIFAREARRKQGLRISQISASGITLSGSAADVLLDAALNDEQNLALIIHEGEERARARLAGASIEDMSAADFRRMAAAERSAGGFKAAGTLIGGIAETGNQLSQSPAFNRWLSGTGRTSGAAAP